MTGKVEYVSAGKKFVRALVASLAVVKIAEIVFDRRLL